MSKLLFAATFASLAFSTGQVGAAPITVEFTGLVVKRFDHQNTEDTSKSGEVVTGRFTFDPSVQAVETWLGGYGMSRFDYGCMTRASNGNCTSRTSFSSPNANVFDVQVDTPYGPLALQPTAGERWTTGGIYRVEEEQGQRFSYDLANYGNEYVDDRYSINSFAQFGIWGSSATKSLFSDLHDLTGLPSIANADQVQFLFQQGSYLYDNTRMTAVDNPENFSLLGTLTSLKIVGADAPDSDIPEPSSVLLMLAGVAGVVCAAKKRKTAVPAA